MTDLQLSDEDFLRELKDRQEIIDLATRYAVAVDTRDWQTFRDCFHPDASGDYSQHVRDYPTLERNARRLDGTGMTHHAVSNFQVMVDGDTATHSCHMVAFHFTEGTPGGDTFTIWGRYSDRLVRTPKGWRIIYRRLDQWHREGNYAVIPPPVSDEPPHAMPG